MSELIINDLHVSIEGKEILKGFNLKIKSGEVHAIMGPNGTGKSTLAYTIMGHPSYQITSGEIFLDGNKINDLAPDERSRAGLFLAFQYPMAIPGVTVANYLRTAVNSHRKYENPEYKGIPIPEFRKMIIEQMDYLKIIHLLEDI
jgi:Fe-S cluster assembly ATP-binding protein